jgi:23S rRNA (guanosine2251-2'-O)-methyltransferase
MQTGLVAVNEKSFIVNLPCRWAALRRAACRDRNGANVLTFRTRIFVRKKSKRSGRRTSSPVGPRKIAKRLPRQISAERPRRNAIIPELAAAGGKIHFGSKVPPFRRAESGTTIIYGFHAAREALRVGRRKLLNIYVTEEAAAKLAYDIACAGVRSHIVEARDIALRLDAGAVHQGVLLEALPLPALDLSDIEAKSGIVLLLDQITDPHNVGAILRTAAAFGVDAVVVTLRHAPDMAGVVAKAASGGLEHVAIVTVTNLARSLERLEEAGYLRVGLDSEAAQSVADAPLRRPIALVMGGEGKGLRRLTKEKCDFLLRLDMPGAIKSLNVSNACAVALALLQAGSGRQTYLSL